MVCTVGGSVYRWDDVVRFATVRGDWDSIVGDAASGLAADASTVDQAEVDEAGRAFRRERGLLAADELADWLEQRGVSVDEWLAYLRRTLARERSPRPLNATVDAASYAWIESMCSGRLDELAETLAQLVAVAPPGIPFEGLEAAFSEFAREAATDAAIDREIASARLDWLRVRYAAALFDTGEAAAEAVLCVREDGQSFADVARVAGAAIAEHAVWLEEVDPALAQLLIAGAPGELVGPVETRHGVLVALVHEKTPVAADDPTVRARAAAIVVDQAASRVATDRVVWHEQL